MSHEVKKRSPQFSLAKKTGYSLGKVLFSGAKLGNPVVGAYSFPFKALGILLKKAAKYGQILL